MRRATLIFILATTLAAAGQSGTSAGSSQQDFNGRSLGLALTDPPLAVQSATVSRTGNPGNVSYYYWIVTQGIAGASSPAGPYVGYSSAATLSGSQFNTISWSVVTNAVTYDVLRTSTPIPPTGACACAVATGISGTTQTDQSNSLNAYTVSALTPSDFNMTWTNESKSAGVTELRLRNKGVQLFAVDSAGNLSCAGICGSGTPGGANTQYQFNDNGALAGNAGHTFNKATGDITASGKNAGIGFIFDHFIDQTAVTTVPSNSTPIVSRAQWFNTGGSSLQTDSWQWQNVMGAQANNPSSTYTLGHSSTSTGTAQVSIAPPVYVAGNRAFVNPSFAGAANTSLQNITGLSFTLPDSLAVSVSFSCYLQYAQAVATAPVTIGVSFSQPPTQAQIQGTIYTSASAFQAGRNGTTTTTPIGIVTGTPSAVSTLFPAEIHGFVENPSQAANTINIMIQTGTGADTVSVQRDSYCVLGG